MSIAGLGTYSSSGYYYKAVTKSTVDKTVTDFLCSIPEMKIRLEGEDDD